MNTFYNKEINLEILIALLKSYGIRKVIASPGMTNSNFVASLQSDSFFEIYSSVDERSAAYMACGMAEESQEPVVISCTGATASREWASGLTEAYYRHLPILAITSSQPNSRIGHLIPQVTDRSRPMSDMVKLSVDMPLISAGGGIDERSLVVVANEALLELKHHGGGPVHINLITNYNLDFSVKELPDAPVICRVGYRDIFPKLPKHKILIAFRNDIFLDKKTVTSLDSFCAHYDARIIVNEIEQPCVFKSKYIVSENAFINEIKDAPYLLIWIGQNVKEFTSLMPAEVWKVGQDGDIIDLYGKLTYVFEMKDEYFFNWYNSYSQKANNDRQNGSELTRSVWKNNPSLLESNDSGRETNLPYRSTKGFLRKLLKK